VSSTSPDISQPGPGTGASTGSWVERDAERVWHGFTQMATYGSNSPVVVERGEGNWLIDVDGRRYLDAISSVWVSTFGHRVPELDQALRDQLDRVAHSTMLGNGNSVVIELAEALAEVVPVDDPGFLFASDGAAAVEQAGKIAYQYWQNKGVPGKTSFLSIGGAYHGDTIGSLSLGADGFGSDRFDPLRFEVVRAPGYDDDGWAETAAELVRHEHPRLAAAIIEPLVQGAAGMQIAAPDAAQRLAAACAEHDVLLICDEVATGFGRTGTLFASEQCELRPDLLCLGKGITGGYLAMSATAASGRVRHAFLGADLGPETLYHGHSYGGNALAAAVALRHLALLDERDALANARERGAELAGLLGARIAERPEVAATRSAGLLAGVELRSDLPPLTARRVCAAAVERGVLLRPIGPVITIVPPLSITSAELELIVSTLEEALNEAVTSQPPS
jgi:adenosylmethionine-8-amino-7-oxononanoate aminotransferase